MSNKKGRLEKYKVTSIQIPSSDTQTPYKYQIQYVYRRKLIGKPIYLVSEEYAAALILMFKKESPKGRVEFGLGLSLLEQKVNAGLSAKQSYDISTTPVQSYG